LFSRIMTTTTSTFFTVLGIALAAASLYFIAERTNIKIPLWILLILAFTPVGTVAIVVMFFIAVFFGLPDRLNLGDHSLFSLFNPRPESVQIPGV
jgi:hypothetical protein